jgi:ribosomal protein L29
MAKKTAETQVSDVMSAKLEAMRIRFRKVLGETVSSHVVKAARKHVAKCVIASEQEKMRGKDA